MLVKEHAGNEVYRVEGVEAKDYLSQGRQGGHMTLLYLP